MGKGWNSIFGLGHPDKGKTPETVVVKGGNPLKKAHEKAKKKPGTPASEGLGSQKVTVTVSQKDGSIRIQHADGRDETFHKGSNPT